MFRLFECCALSFFERFVLSFSLKIERFVSDSAEIWICGLYICSCSKRRSKISYVLDHKPSRHEERDIERKMNELIDEDLPVSFEFVNRDNVPEGVSLDRLPEDASEILRLVRIGDYDVCPCIGKHVRSTSQIGRFEILGTNWDEEKHTFRIRFKIVQ